MHRAHLRKFRPAIATTVALALAVSAAPAAAAGYLKLGDIKGESSDKGHKNEIEILSWSWGASQASSKVSKVDAITVKQAAKDGAKGGNVEYEWKVEEGESAPPRPGGATDIATAETASGLPTGKRQHKPMTVTRPVDKATPKLAEAVARGKAVPSEPRPGRGTLTVMVPAGTCVAGARYAGAELGTGERVYTLADVVVTNCSPAASSGGDRPMESLSLNYSKVTW